MFVLGFCGLAKSGKDAAGSFAYQRGYDRFAFGDKLKEALVALNPVIGIKNDQPVYLKALVNQIGMEKAKHHPEVRRLLQRLGTECGRDTISEDIWITAVSNAIKHYDFRTDPFRVAITDVRFPNEAEFVKRNKGIVVLVIRPGIEPLRDDKGRIHISEQNVMDGRLRPDWQLANTGTLEDLQVQVNDMITAYEEGRATVT